MNKTILARDLITLKAIQTPIYPLTNSFAGSCINSEASQIFMGIITAVITRMPAIAEIITPFMPFICFFTKYTSKIIAEEETKCIIKPIIPLNELTVSICKMLTINKAAMEYAGPTTNAHIISGKSENSSS